MTVSVLGVVQGLLLAIWGAEPASCGKVGYLSAPHNSGKRKLAAYLPGWVNMRVLSQLLATIFYQVPSACCLPELDMHVVQITVTERNWSQFLLCIPLHVATPQSCIMMLPLLYLLACERAVPPLVCPVGLQFCLPEPLHCRTNTRLVEKLKITKHTYMYN